MAPLQLELTEEYLTELSDGVATVKVLAEELDVYNTPSLRGGLERAVYHPHTTEIVADMRGVVEADTVALGALVSTLKLAIGNEKSFVLQDVQPEITKKLAITGLDRIFQLRKSESEDN